MTDNTSVGISKDFKNRLDQLAAKETIRCGTKITPSCMIEILIVEKEGKKT